MSSTRGRVLRAVGVALTAIALAIGFAFPAAAAELMRVTFVRHAQSEGNASGLIDTSTPGPNITALGQQQAQAVVGTLGNNNYDAIYASQMVRTQQTAAPLADYLRLPGTGLPGIQEIEAGVFEGTPESQAAAGYGRVLAGWAPGGAQAADSTGFAAPRRSVISTMRRQDVSGPRAGAEHHAFGDEVAQRRREVAPTSAREWLLLRPELDASAVQRLCNGLQALHLALPAQNGFFRDQQKPSASVLLTLHPGRTLDRAQIAGIVHLVASSVPEMNPSAVSVLDDTGKLLSANPDAAAGVDDRQLRACEQVRRFGDGLEVAAHAVRRRTHIAGRG